MSTPEPAPEATVRDNPTDHRFEVFLGTGLAGFATYEERPGALAILHIEIDPAFEGHGLGSILVRGALESVRERGLAVLPYCPFVKVYLKKHPEYVDLVPAAQRERFGIPSV